MNVLGIDGALGRFSAAVVRDGSVAAAVAREGNVALEAGLGLISDAMRDAGVDPGSLDRIAVGKGPGSFTGLRIAIAYAKSLAQGWRLPLYGISSFDILEYGYSLEAALTIVVGRPGVISARYRNAGVRRASGWIAAALDQVLPQTPPNPLSVLGAPKDVLAALAERAIIVRPLDPLVPVPAAAAALIAASIPTAGTVHDVRPDYGELPAAKIPKIV